MATDTITTKEQLKGLVLDILKEQDEAKETFLENSRDDVVASPKAIVAELLAQQAAKAQSQNPEKGMLAARFVRGLAANKGDITKAQEWANKFYKGDEALEKAFQIGGDGTNFLMPDEVSADMVEMLYNATVVRSLGPVILPMNKATMIIPAMESSATAYYGNPNAEATESKPAVTDLKLVFKKLQAFIGIGNDLLRYSSPGADMLVRNDLATIMGVTEDLAFLRGTGLEDHPKGMRYWCSTANTLTTAGTTLANVSTDLSSLILALLEGNCRMLKPAWIMAPRTMMYLKMIMDSNGNYVFKDEMSKGTLLGYPYRSTNQIPINLAVSTSAESEITFVDMADFIIGESMGLTIDTDPGASYIDHDGNTVHSFQKDQTTIRAIAEHDCGMRHIGSVAVMTQVKYGV